LWGTNWPIMKIVLNEWDVWHFRSVGLFAATIGFFVLAHSLGYPLKVPKGEWGRLVAAAVFNVTCWQLFSGYGVAMLASGRASIIAYTMPLWVVPLSMWLLKEQMSRRKLLGLALGFCGLMLLIGDDLFRLQQAPLGTLLMLGAAISWSIGIVIIKRWPVALPVTTMTGWMMLLGGLPIHLGAPLIAGPASRCFRRKRGWRWHM
jgi:drug/metabolite transporter (DMT)-like permease